MAENFLKKSPNHASGYRVNPAGVLPAVKCLGAIFRLNPRPPALIEVRTHLQLGALLHRETQNVDLAKQHLEQAWYQSQTMPQLEDVKYEAGCCLAEIYADAGQIVQAKQVLQKAIESSQRLPYWHCRLLFQLANLLVTEKDYNSAVQILDAGVGFSYMAGAYYTRMLFLLSKAMLFLLERRFADANPILQQTGPLIETWVQQSSGHQKENVAKHQKEYLQIFFLVLQVCYYLMVGQVKSVKTVLKQLQQSIQTVTSPGWPADEEMVPSNAADNFQWLTKDHLCILVYLVTVMHSMQAGYMDKAQKYTDKAIAQIDKLRNSYDAKPLLLSSFQALLMEHIVQCRLVTGNKEGAVQEIGNLCRLLQSNQLLLQRHRAQLHTMLGLYAMSMNCMDAAENQFNAALRVSYYF